MRRSKSLPRMGPAVLSKNVEGCGSLSWHGLAAIRTVCCSRSTGAGLHYPRELQSSNKQRRGCTRAWQAIAYFSRCSLSLSVLPCDSHHLRIVVKTENEFQDVSSTDLPFSAD